MTQKEKQLLLKDLCARLPYGIYVDAYSWQKDTPKLLIECVPEYVGEEIVVKRLAGRHSIREIKPYLRPMSSMTEEEKEEIEVFIFNEWYEADSCKIDKEGWIEILANYDVSGIDPCFCSDYVDWLNEHHFDYRGLIEKGLALEAPEGMYKTK